MIKFALCALMIIMKILGFSKSTEYGQTEAYKGN